MIYATSSSEGPALGPGLVKSLILKPVRLHTYLLMRKHAFPFLITGGPSYETASCNMVMR